MIPILYSGNEQSFLHNGMGRLSDAITCKVTEERNGVFELEMTYPITGIHYADIAENAIIYVKTEDGGHNQAFIIYKISRPLNGVVTINAQHISYLLNGFIVFPFTASSLSDAMSKIVQNTVPASIPFTFYTDVVSSVHFELSEPRPVRALLGGQRGSLLDVFGGYDYQFDNFSVKLLQSRGNDNGVSIRYGKNLTGLKNVDDMTSVYTGIVPYWQDTDGNSVYLTEKVVYSEYASYFPYKIIKTVDFSSDFDTAPTEAQLRQKAQSYIENNKGWKIKNNIDVSFVALSQSEEYKNIAPLENVKLCDTVTIRYDKLGVDTKAQVIKTVYNVLLERYESITLGDTTYTLAQAIQGQIDEPIIAQSKSFTKSAVEHATKLIQGGLGGHVVFNTDGNGEPQEILIMDADNIEEAVEVIRMNLNGIGFSHNGYSGPFETAWTIDGSFVADFITTGNLNASLLTVGSINADLITTGSLNAQRITAGILKDDNNNNSWNLDTGEFKLSASATVGGNTVQQIADNSASSAVTSYDNSLDQEEVFNKLTNDGETQGIYLQNGLLYINGQYIKANSISANALSISAQSAIGGLHNYLPFDLWSNINRIKAQYSTMNAPYFTTISGVKYIALNGTNLSSYNQYYSAVCQSDYVGKPTTINVHIVVRFSAAWTVSNASHDLVIFFYTDINNTGRSISAVRLPQGTTYQANTDYTFDATVTFTYSAAETGNPRIFIPYVNGVITYVKEYTVTGQTGDYQESQMTFTSDGLNSTVQKGSIISSINQSAESVSINASKINLTGDLSLHGDFTSYNASDNTTYAFLDSGKLSFYNQGSNVFTISSTALYGSNAGIFFGDAQDPTSMARYTNINQELITTPSIYLKSDGHYSARVTQGYGIVAESTSYMGTVWIDSIQIGGQSDGTGNHYNYCWNDMEFRGTVYDATGTTVFVSDQRKKRSIKDLVIEKAKSFIMGLKPRKFKFNKDISQSDRYHHGFIAQEVKEAMGEDWGVYVEDKERDFIGLRYDELIADMVAVMQDQEKRIEALERRLNDITNNQP